MIDGLGLANGHRVPGGRLAVTIPRTLYQRLTSKIIDICKLIQMRRVASTCSYSCRSCAVRGRGRFRRSAVISVAVVQSAADARTGSGRLRAAAASVLPQPSGEARDRPHPAIAMHRVGTKTVRHKPRTDSDRASFAADAEAAHWPREAVAERRRLGAGVRQRCRHRWESQPEVSAPPRQVQMRRHAVVGKSRGEGQACPACCQFRGCSCQAAASSGVVPWLAASSSRTTWSAL